MAKPAAQASVGFKHPTCEEVSCDQPVVGLMVYYCHYHDALRQARELSHDDLTRLRAEMADLVPLTAEQKRERSIGSRLWSVTHHANELARAETSAREAGATGERIAEARAKRR